ncbi:multifunctional 2',3'-cyclic-nucleotide 2'-phosphodiesterase/5'-nucleotidase/3'-nucleotidase [Deltaproteobacteria bacterium]|nr:multifunctional 2',3'-cyclic-nucleotide 2'-phosphodiesterase/5'-nucleotidase/3'-nucleotidase [Deltaproteobacteria bacterium]
MLTALLMSSLGACVPTPVDGGGADLEGQPVRLTFLHTSDVHSRLYEYEFTPSFTDTELGLQEGLGPYGGLAEMAYILKRERAKAGRVLHLDSGDCFQGAVVFNQFSGEAEFRTMSAAGLDAAVVANHEFDAGAANLATQGATWARFDLLAANYDFADSELPYANELEDLVLPTGMYELDGLRVGVIGMGNISSLNSIYDQSNSMGIRVIEPGQAIPDEAVMLRAEGADLIVVLSHLGLDEDIENAKLYKDIDIILGGHNHIALDPPLVVVNEETGKRIPIVHSGAFAKFVGRLDVVVQDGEVLSTDYQLFPIDGTVPEDPEVAEILLEYKEQLDYDLKLDQVIGYAETELTRYGTTGGDSMLGNLTAEAMRFYPGVETEIALTNTLGIRSDIPAGDITLDTLYNSMPFDNTVTTMFLSGREVQELLDYATERSTERGCESQIQVAGIKFTMNCEAAVAEDIVINGTPLSPEGTYELATNNYIAHGGSGFEVLERNTTQIDTGISIRDVVKQSISAARTLPQKGICEEDGRIATVY